jgi:hypothetical protein
MYVIQDHQVAVDSWVADDFSVRHSDLKDCICFLHSSCLCVGQS